MKPGQRLEQLVIDAVDDEGRGRCVVDGPAGQTWDVAVRGGLPGDVVKAAEVEVCFVQRGLVQARRLDVLQGPLHDERLCGHTGPCAACPLHGVDDGFVNALKRERVRVAFADVGLVVDVAEVVAGDGERQKVKLIPFGRPGELRLGHYLPHTHIAAPGWLCGVTRDAIVDVVDRTLEAMNRRNLDAAVVKAVIAREFVEGVGVVIVASDRRALTGLRVEGCIGLAWRLDGREGNSLVGGDIVEVDGDVMGTPLDGGPRCQVDAFCQADLGGAALLVDRAADFVGGADDEGGVCFDLYAGTGAFARALVGRGARVVAVEVADVSVRALATLDGVTAVKGRVGAVVEQLRSHGVPRGIVVDPPRQGLGADASAIAGLGAARVAVVSCDVDNGAKDVKAFVDAGYDVVEVVPVDLFPGSAEVEVLTLLKIR